MTKYDLFADNVTYRARGFSWVDPQKEINASIAAVSNGIISLQDVHAQYGKDTEEVFEAISREKDLAAQYNIETAFEPFGQKAPAQPKVEGQNDGEL
jgi:capsid protein